VEGSTAYPAPQLAAITAGLVGPAIPVARIEAARVALLNLYREDGYALTTVTATIDPRGALRFTVVEGRIADVKLEGDIGPAGVQVLRFLRHLTEARPIDTATLERWLLLAQDVPGITLRAVLQPSAADAGALTLVAQVEHKTLSGLLSVDNRAAPVTGTQQGLVMAEVDSVTQFGERSQVTLYHTNGNTQNFGQGSIEAFLGGSGLRLRVYGGYGEANPSDFLRAIGYNGTTGVVGAALTYPLIRARQQTLNVSVALDAINSTIRTNQGQGGSSIVTGKDDLRIVRLGGDYALQDGLLGDSRPAVNAASLRLSQGLPGLGASPNGSPTASRLNEKVDFTKVGIDLSRVQTLFQAWSNASVALKGRVLGQASGDVLPPAEKFFLGGAEFNRGYYSGEVTGDSALVLSAELQLNTGYDVPLFGRVFPINAQFYAFYDYGRAWQNQRLDANATLQSEGVGVRFTVTEYTEFNIEGVHRNTRFIGGSGPGVSPLKADALYWRAVTRF
jgi:hemolysin activation/secretion protein